MSATKSKHHVHTGTSNMAKGFFGSSFESSGSGSFKPVPHAHAFSLVLKVERLPFYLHAETKGVAPEKVAETIITHKRCAECLSTESYFRLQQEDDEDGQTYRNEP